MAKRATAGAKPRGKKGGASEPPAEAKKNALSEDDLRPFLDEMHDLTDNMEEYSATKRSQIGKVYDKMVDKLGLTKGAVKLVFRKERGDRKTAAKVAKMDSSDRDALERASAAFGGSMGDWLSDMADRAGTAPKEDEGEE